MSRQWTVTVAVDPTLQAIAEAAVDATGASHAWLLSYGDGGLRVVAACGSGAGAAVGRVIDAGGGSAGYVVASGQPLALQPRPGDSQPWSTEHALLGRTPTSIVAAPCEADGTIVGVLELVDKADGPFSFDDVEIVALLSGIAGIAMEGGPGPGKDVAGPAELTRELARLAQDDLTSYVRIARVIEALLAHG